MAAALIIATVLDLALGVLLISVSGFILQGVNNTGPLIPDAVFFVAMTIFCFAAPLIAWLVRKQLASPIVVVIAFAPLMVAGIVLLAEPVFV